MLAYVRLLNEGTEVFRPVTLEEVAVDRWRLVATSNYDPADEEWEVLPGEFVTTTNHPTTGGDLIAVVQRAEAK